MANPGLNGLILGVLLIGIILGLRQVTRLMPEIRWINGVAGVGKPTTTAPVLLAPMATMFGGATSLRSISTLTLRPCWIRWARGSMNRARSPATSRGC